jgi:hypothetical protein
VDPAVWRVLFWRRLTRLGYPFPRADLGYWELMLLAMIEEKEDERREYPGT